MPEIHNDIIDQGSTYYRLVQLWADKAKTVPYDLTDKTVRSVGSARGSGALISFSVAVIGERTAGLIAWVMPRTDTINVDPWETYDYQIDVDYDDGITTERAQVGELTVRGGRLGGGVE